MLNVEYESSVQLIFNVKYKSSSSKCDSPGPTVLLGVYWDWDPTQYSHLPPSENISGQEICLHILDFLFGLFKIQLHSIQTKTLYYV